MTGQWNGLAAVILLGVLANCGAASERKLSSFTLSSSAFADGQALPAEFGCEGRGHSPPLAWSEPPAGTRGFALVVDDPDAPGGTFRHWGAYDIPASAREFPSGASPPGQARNDFGNPGYGAPCPPRGHGPHHYRFKLYALDVDRLAIAPNGKVTDVETAAAKHVIGHAELTGTYERK